jgi:hypothetical protein
MFWRFIAQVSPYSNSLGVANCFAADHRPGAEYAKTVKGNSELWGMLICIALVWKALPGVAMVVVLHVDRMAPA